MSEQIQMVNKYMKIHSCSLVVSKIQINVVINFDFTYWIVKNENE